MFNSPVFRRMLFVSLLAHSLFFGLFSFSFGRRTLRLEYPAVNFLGSFLGPLDLTRCLSPGNKIITLNKQDDFLPQTKIDKETVFLQYYQKPQVRLVIRQEKVFYTPPESFYPVSARRKQSVIMLYPPLPYHFLLYFKDRQRAHIELMYNTISGVKSNSVVLKRKISSGNLEADLLSMRYIGHYLFTQTAYPAGNGWQTVRIDLEPRKEQ
ncbi:MAG: hypothetical protein NT033_04415 [Candidatus Omnitrophica bacterium]|nr:hypothetical protein [Candidatus Omnitrophota bacterium]